MRHILTLTELTAESASWESSAGHVLSIKWKGKHGANLYCWNCLLGVLQRCLGQGNCREFSKNQKFFGLCVSPAFTQRGYTTQSRSVRNQTSPGAGSAQLLGSEWLLNNSHTKLGFIPTEQTIHLTKVRDGPCSIYHLQFKIVVLTLFTPLSLHLSSCVSGWLGKDFSA